MKYDVTELSRAQLDIQHIFHWIFERSLIGAAAWMTAYETMLKRLEHDPNAFPVALENKDCEFEIREALFRTRRGKTYRAVFFVEDNNVNIARVRGPGQAQIEPGDV